MKSYVNDPRPGYRPVNVYKVKVDGKIELLPAFEASYKRLLEGKKVVLMDQKPVSQVYEIAAANDDLTEYEADYLAELERPEDE